MRVLCVAVALVLPGHALADQVVVARVGPGGLVGLSRAMDREFAVNAGRAAPWCRGRSLCWVVAKPDPGNVRPLARD